jgi:hypothetical protein
MGGSDNLVDLTQQEHFVAHQLLVKMHPERPSLIWALACIMGGERRNNKYYGWIRTCFAVEMSKPKSVETRRKMSEYWSAYRKANPVSDEERQRMRERNLGKKLSAETKAKCSAVHKGKVFSEEHRENIGKARRGKKMPPKTEEYKQMQRVWAERKAAGVARGPHIKRSAEELRIYKRELARQQRARKKAAQVQIEVSDD